MGAVGAVLGAVALPTAAPARPLQPAQTLDIGSISRASGMWQVDWQRAQRDADAVLAQIDMSKRDIVIWVPGTSNQQVLPAFREQITTAYGSDVSLVSANYEASWQMRRSTPTGLATLLLVLQELRKRKRPQQRVFLGGESQGAWIVGEAMAHPSSSIVTRAVITGHPWVAKHHYDDGHDPRVQEINHIGDQVTLPIQGSVADGLDAMVAIHTLQLSKIGTVVRAIAANPMHGWILLRDAVMNLPGLKKYAVKTHVYDYEMPAAVAFLRDGIRTSSLKPARTARELGA